MAWRWQSDAVYDTDALISAMYDTCLSGALQVMLSKTVQMSSNRLIYKGIVVDELLWDPELDGRIQIMASDPRVIECICGCAVTLVKSQPAIVVGREAGSRCFPGAQLKIELVASDETRFGRKISQLSIADEKDYWKARIDRPEPTGLGGVSSDLISIDTSIRNLHEVIDMIVSLISSRLGWVPGVGPEPGEGT
jgi:cytidylate kinase